MKKDLSILNVDTEKQRLGRFGERAAARYLFRHGYLIRRMNYVWGKNEIDIIATKGDTAAFVEVKTRSVEKMSPRERRPASSVTAKKQRGIMRTAAHYAAWHTRNKKRRFDIIEVYVKTENGGKTVADIRHLINTYNVHTAFGVPVYDAYLEEDE